MLQFVSAAAPQIHDENREKAFSARSTVSAVNFGRSWGQCFVWNDENREHVFFGALGVLRGESFSS